MIKRNINSIVFITLCLFLLFRLSDYFPKTETGSPQSEWFTLIGRDQLRYCPLIGGTHVMLQTRSIP